MADQIKTPFETCFRYVRGADGETYLEESLRITGVSGNRLVRFELYRASDLVMEYSYQQATPTAKREILTDSRADWWQPDEHNVPWQPYSKDDVWPGDTPLALAA